MVKRIKQDDMAGTLEFSGVGKDDPRLQAWLEEHRARKGGNVRVALGATGVRVTLAKEADLRHWRGYQEAFLKASRAA